MTTVMSVTTAVVVALSLRASAQGHGAGGSVDPVAVAPAGVVAAAPKTATPSAAAPSKTPASPKARATRTPKAPQALQTPKARQTRAPRHPTSRTPRPSPSPSSVTVNGAVTDTMYGPVQVQVTVRGTVQGTRIVSAHAIDYPQGGGRDQEINSRAIPALDQETVQAQSARIDTVSGATYTSDGYRRSLQSALDAAHRAA